MQRAVAGSRFSDGRPPAAAPRRAAPAAGQRPAPPGSGDGNVALSIGGPSLQREQPSRPALDEQHDRDQHEDLGEHGAGTGFQHLVDARRGPKRADQRAGQGADAAEHHHHEAVDDVAGAEVGRDVVDLATAPRRRGRRGPSRSAKVSASTRPVRMPMVAAMRRFCITARISQPEARQPDRGETSASTARPKKMIHSRFWVTATPPGSISVPCIQDGARSPPGSARRRRRARPAAGSCRRRRSSAASRAAGRTGCRISPRSSSAPAAPVTRKAAGTASGRAPGRQPGDAAAQLLHHEGGIGAEHDEFAMRHVDHAHHAEGDGEAERGQQQHRAEREALEQRLRHAADRKLLLDGGDRRRRSR